MKLQVMSDLHLESAPFVPTCCGADVVILAGDIAVGAEGVLWAREMFQMPVIYVCGNHEYHGSYFSIAEHLETMKREADDSNVILLDNEAVVINGIRFLGTTMWTDLGDFGSVLYCDHDNIVIENDAEHEAIHFSVRQQQALFERNREWLRAELATPFTGKTVVVTHHAPSLKSMHPQHAVNPWNPCFMSDLESLMPGVDLWVHGHTHSSFDYRVGSTRVVCNPRGYQNHDGGWENLAFNPTKTVEV